MIRIETDRFRGMVMRRTIAVGPIEYVFDRRGNTSRTVSKR